MLTNGNFRFIEELGNHILLPKGFIGKLIRFCRENSIAYNFIDQRKLNSPVTYSFQATLRPYQQESMEAISKKDIGVIVAPPGSGKTVMALKLLGLKVNYPALKTSIQKEPLTKSNLTKISRPSAS